MTLREALEAKHVEQMRNEQVIRTTLVDQKEAALREVECVWRERYNTLKKQVGLLLKPVSKLQFPTDI